MFHVHMATEAVFQQGHGSTEKYPSNISITEITIQFFIRFLNSKTLCAL